MALYASTQHEVGSIARMGSGYFPTLIGRIMAFLVLVILLLSFRKAVHELQQPAFTPRPVWAVIAAVALLAVLIMRIGLIPPTMVVTA